MPEAFRRWRVAQEMPVPGFPVEHAPNIKIDHVYRYRVDLWRA